MSRRPGLVISLLLLGLFSPVVTAEAIIRPDRDVRPGEARWTAQITEDFGAPYGRQSVCTGVLVKVRVVVTAAHCITEDSDFDSWLIRIGNRSSDMVDGETRRPLAIVYHGKYTRTQSYDILDEDGNLLESVEGVLNPGENDLDSDIAIIYLDRAVHSVRPARLPRSSGYQPAPGWRTYGWGYTGESEDSEPGTLLTAAQHDHTARSAAEYEDPFHHLLSAVAVVDGLTSGTCWGDSGGPLIDGRGVLIGLTSSASAQFCSDPEPTLFTKMSSYLNWLPQAERVARRAADVVRNGVRTGTPHSIPVLAYEQTPIYPSH
jgi:secreted trypsin-like serine protease